MSINTTPMSLNALMKATKSPGWTIICPETACEAQVQANEQAAGLETGLRQKRAWRRAVLCSLWVACLLCVGWSGTGHANVAAYGSSTLFAGPETVRPTKLFMEARS